MKAIQSGEDIQVIIDSTQQILDIEGDIIEVGVYEGGSANIINNILTFNSSSKKLFLCDTFEGLKDSSEDINDCTLPNGAFASDFENVKNIFSNYENVKVIKGYFPESATEEIKESKFSLVHLDVDTYLSTLNCLEFFYSKINKGGIIISHDYNSIPGVTRAIDFFFSDKPEIINGDKCAPGVCSQISIIKL